MIKTPVLIGRRVRLTPFGVERITEQYLGWLSDPHVNQYSRRLDMAPVTHDMAAEYLACLRPGEAVLAVETHGYGHIGNVKFGPIDRANARCDIAIMMGETSAWGKGYGAEAVYLVTRWLFEIENLKRADAASVNPAFVRLVQKIGWRIERVEPASVTIGCRTFDRTHVAIHAHEFDRRPDYEPLDGLSFCTPSMADNSR